MKLGTIHNWGENLEAYRSDLRVCSDLGYDYIGIGDSPAGWHDMFLSMAIAVEETQMATVVPMVTSTLLRQPIVTANGIASLHEMSSGRDMLGYARGGSSVMSIGREPAHIVPLARAITPLRTLVAGRGRELQGRGVQ